MNENNKNIQGISENGYERIDKFDGKRTEELAKSYHKILKNIGEDPNREGLRKTPERVAKSLQFLTHGYNIGFITGLSKIARVVDAFSRRLQVQERLTLQIRDCIHNTLKPLGVAVVIEALHLCIAMRGVQKQNSVATTSAFTGWFLKEQRTREEFIHLIGVKLH